MNFRDPTGLEYTDPGKDKMDDKPWGDTKENGIGGFLRSIGCLITSISNAIKGLSSEKVDPGLINKGSNFNTLGFSPTLAAQAFNLNYAQTDTDIASKLKELRDSDEDFSAIVDAKYKYNGKYAEGTHKVNVIDFIDGPTGKYVKVQGTSSKDYKANNRESWIVSDGTILIPIGDIERVRWLWK